MSVSHSQHSLARLVIPQSLNAQQPVSFDNQPLFSPALPTSIQQGMHPPFSFNPVTPGTALPTPLQSSFYHVPPNAPGRPINHRAHASVAQLAAAGIHPPSVLPMTPLGQGQFPPGPFPMILPGQPFPPHNRARRAPSISTGGPPKAVLGGPAAKPRVNPEAMSPSLQPIVPVKVKKVVINFPKETVAAGDDQLSRREPWARTPLRPSEVPELIVPELVEAITIPTYPADQWRHTIPEIVDVFLPGKPAWDEYRKWIINEKLDRLGIEQGFGGTGSNASSNIPHIHAPHARAASISSPADPAMLIYKLNKLQQSQDGSSINSMSSSPHVQANMTPSPHLPGMPPRIRHTHSMSLVNTGSVSLPAYNPTDAFNPFGPLAVLGSDEILRRDESNLRASTESTSSKSISPAPAGLSGPTSRPDFVVGFGLDIPEEEEPEESEEVQEDEDKDTEVEEEGDILNNKAHSRHRSRLSAVLSLRSFHQNRDPLLQIIPPARNPTGNPAVDDLDVGDKDAEAVGEWTGSEDLRNAAGSEAESIGEWSNPSDEERARQGRRQRRMIRRAQSLQIQQQDIPRKIPNFPRPPASIQIPSLPDEADEDVLSNPSDEERGVNHQYSRPLSNASGQGRPLPPLPHSRTTSQFSSLDPALAHSRTESSEVPGHNGFGSAEKMPSLYATGRAILSSASLNPLAKPFIFGANQSSPFVNTSLQTNGHVRSVSIGKRLNATASEFKPSFTFKLPPLAPQFSFPPPIVQEPTIPFASGRPLPTPPALMHMGSRENQGREKRQRRGSSVTLDGDERRANMTAFKFPPPSEIGKTIHRSAPPTPAAFEPERRNSFNAPQHFTVAGFLSDMPLRGSPEPPGLRLTDTKSFTGARELPIPPQPKPKRAPIPLDFKHPVSTNTVPAGLFKALINGEDDRSKRSVRSRLSSRDVFDHSPRPSLDDSNVQTISKKIARPRLLTDPHNREEPEELEVTSASSRRRRRSSLPALRSAAGSSFPDLSISPSNLTRNLDMHQLEQRLEILLDEKLSVIRYDILRHQGDQNSGINKNTEAMINEVVSLFRTQLQESAARGLDDSEADAHGELDLELIKGIIDQANMDTRAVIQRDMTEILRRVEIQTRTPGMHHDLTPFVDEITTRTVNAVVGATQQLAARIEATSSSSAVVRELMNILGPQFAALRPEPIDYDGLTHQLSQAVKPNISQLIDLASDKRETAGLILDRLLPVLQALEPSIPEFDVNDITTKIVAEVRKVVGQVDAHEIKEQVSDLVVERLDARLANRDRLEGLGDKMIQAVHAGLGPVPGEIASILGKLATIHRDISDLNPEDLSSLRHDVVSIIADIPHNLAAATEAMNAALVDLRLKRSIDEDTRSPDDHNAFELQLAELTSDQKSVLAQTQEIISLHQDVISHLSALPASLVEATNGLQDSQENLVSRIQIAQKDAEELRQLSASNAELQVQLAKSRGSHGQVRVEKDVIGERLVVVEAEKDRLRTQLDEMLVKAADAAATEARNLELEESLAHALARLQSVDASAQKYQERIMEFEKLNRDLAAEDRELHSKVHSRELEIVTSIHNKEAAEERAAALQKQLDQIDAQQEHWDEMHRASEQISHLLSLVEQGDNEEIKELRINRDRTKLLEGEFAALQRRFKDQENKVSSHERAMAGVRQNLAQAQQRAAEWEKRSKDQEAEIESTRSRLDEADQAHSQLDAELSLVKLQLQEKEADERTAKDRESKLRDQVAAFEEQVARLRVEVDQAKAKTVAPVFVPRANGLAPASANNNSPFNPPPRPDSRASTAYGPSRSVTPTRSSEKPTRAQLASKGVWSSMHNPYRSAPPATPKARYAQSFRAPSPTSSIISVTPSVDADGWWS